MKWRCTICGWIYDPEKGAPEKKIEPVTAPRISDVVSCAFPATGTASIMTTVKAASTDPVNRDLLFILNPQLSKKMQKPESQE